VSTTHTTSRPVGRRRDSDGPASWLRDLLLGIRLAVGGGRTSWSRLALGTIGIGLAVAILLIAASVPTAMHHRTLRELAQTPVTTARAGVGPLYELTQPTTFRNDDIEGTYLYPTGAHSPVPPGLTALPKADEVVLSPALADLLDSSAGRLLRPRFPEKVIGTIGEAGLQQPSELAFFTGAGGQLAKARGVQSVYGFGVPPGPGMPVDPVLIALVVIGAVVLLLPIVIFVGVSSRIAGAQRDRRLAALRLVGAGSFQTRRIAAAESLVTAATGLVLGALVFLLAKQAAGGVRLLQFSVFSNDIVPMVALLVPVVLLIPVISVGTSLLAMRRTVVEPLGVVRESRPVRRRLWWRLALFVLGAVLVLRLPRSGIEDTTWTAQLAVGASALLVGVPAMVPWLLERAVSALRGGRPSWQLAVRRLQLDSGTPARVVGGVAVVLAGAITLQTVLVATFERYQVNDDYGTTTTSTGQVFGQVQVQSGGDIADRVTAAVRGASGVHQVFPYRDVHVVAPSTAQPDGSYLPEQDLTVADCQVIQDWFGLSGCHDGDVFSPRYQFNSASASGGTTQQAMPLDTSIVAGSRLRIVQDVDDTMTARPLGEWTVPAQVRPFTVKQSLSQFLVFGDLIVTPGAFHAAVPLTDLDAEDTVEVTENPDVVENIANTLAPFTWRASAFALFSLPGLSNSQQTLVTIRQGLLIGALFTLLLAAASLLVLALEQIQERRRPLAALAATGVPRSMLARSLLWQTALPVVIAVALAIAVGLALSAMVLRFTSIPMVFDWADIGVFSAAAAGLVLVVTLLSLPALRNATRLGALRAE
jgi:hypothetical protein